MIFFLISFFRNNLTDVGLMGIENCFFNLRNILSLELDFAKFLKKIHKLKNIILIRNLINEETGLKSLNKGLLCLEKLSNLNINFER